MLYTVPLLLLHKMPMLHTVETKRKRGNYPLIVLRISTYSLKNILAFLLVLFYNQRANANQNQST
jgi:hypothetical protein